VNFFHKYQNEKFTPFCPWFQPGPLFSPCLGPSHTPQPPLLSQRQGAHAPPLFLLLLFHPPLTRLTISNPPPSNQAAAKHPPPVSPPSSPMEKISVAVRFRPPNLAVADPFSSSGGGDRDWRIDNGSRVSLIHCTAGPVPASSFAFGTRHASPAPTLSSPPHAVHLSLTRVVRLGWFCRPRVRRGDDERAGLHVGRPRAHWRRCRRVQRDGLRLRADQQRQDVHHERLRRRPWHHPTRRPRHLRHRAPGASSPPHDPHGSCPLV
jgi:hypothetical protein